MIAIVSRVVLLPLSILSVRRSRQHIVNNNNDHVHTTSRSRVNSISSDDPQWLTGPSPAGKQSIHRHLMQQDAAMQWLCASLVCSATAIQGTGLELAGVRTDLFHCESRHLRGKSVLGGESQTSSCSHQCPSDVLCMQD